VTAFTVGHSITLTLAVLDLVRVPTAPIELAIALSVFWLAVELAREPGARPTLVRRRPYLMAGLFGLLHGLGFAGALLGGLLMIVRLIDPLLSCASILDAHPGQFTIRPDQKFAHILIGLHVDLVAVGDFLP
jgi:hypothetical protein